MVKATTNDTSNELDFDIQTPTMALLVDIQLLNREEKPEPRVGSGFKDTYFG